MIAKVIMGNIKNIKNIVSVAEKIPYDTELRCGRYNVNAKSILGVLSLPNAETGELRIHTDDAEQCDIILNRLLEMELLVDTNDSVRRSLFDITAFGELLIDFTWQGISDFGQTLFAQNPGGAPANVLVAAGRLGAHTAFLGKVGNDMHGDFLKKTLDKENINTQGLIVDDEYFTTLAFVNLNEQGERTFSFARKPGADTMMQKEEIDVDVLDNTHIFHVGSLSLTSEPSRSTTFYAVKRAKEKGSIISYDPNYRASLWENEEAAKQHMRSLIPYVDLMKISDEETELLTDEKDVEKASKKLFEQGVKIVMVTLGKDGAYVYHKDGGYYVEGFKSNVLDTTGAGDSCWGGFLYWINKSGRKPEDISSDELKEFARFGNAVASLCVEGKGAIPSMPFMEQVEERLRR